MSAADWSAILRLGEELLRLRSLPAQRDRIVATAEQLFQAQAELWLDEWLFRLPGIETDPAFSLAPPARAIAQALASGRLYHCREGEQVWAAAPLIAQGMLLGALQIGRAGGKPFRRRELDFLQGLAGHVALAIYTAHRLAVEEWRLEQLTLVRRVSAQLARLTDADELAQRVARLIQETFHYYYVALFTCEVGEPVLRLRSSAPAERGFPPTEPLRIRLGEGLIGLAAQTGQEILANDVSVEPRFRYVASLPETRAEVVRHSCPGAGACGGKSRSASSACWTCNRTAFRHSIPTICWSCAPWPIPLRLHWRARACIRLWRSAPASWRWWPRSAMKLPAFSNRKSYSAG
jgi:GAF domain-containing protein